MNLIRTLLWHLDVARRARKARRRGDLGGYLVAMSAVGPGYDPPDLYVLEPAVVAHSLADDARDELLAAVTFDVRRGVASPDVRAAFVTWKEATA